jgi:hypothetical protein
MISFEVLYLPALSSALAVNTTCDFLFPRQPGDNTKQKNSIMQPPEYPPVGAII